MLSIGPVAELQGQDALFAVRKLRGAQSLDGGRLGAEEPDVAQVVDAWRWVGAAPRRIEAGGDLLEASGRDQLGEGGVDLIGDGAQHRTLARQGAAPAIGRGIVCGVTDDDRRLVQRRVVGADGGVEVGLGER